MKVGSSSGGILFFKFDVFKIKFIYDNGDSFKIKTLINGGNNAIFKESANQIGHRKTERGSELVNSDRTSNLNCLLFHFNNSTTKSKNML